MADLGGVDRNGALRRVRMMASGKHVETWDLSENDVTSLRMVVELLDQAWDDATVLRLALKRIDEIRNSIVGAQTVNWSEHIYPLVAALEGAGYKGQSYETARENVGTLIERANKAEARAKGLEAALVKIAENDAGNEQAHDWPDFYDSVRRFARDAIEAPPRVSGGTDGGR